MNEIQTLKEFKVFKEEGYKSLGNSVTVCISTRLDRIKFTTELIKSIYNQKILPNNILFALSGRSFQTLNRSVNQLEEILSKEKVITENNHINRKYIYCPKNGVAAARNIASEVVNDDILFFSDDDDIWHNNKISETLKAIKKNNLKSVVRHGFDTLNNNKIQKCNAIYNKNISFTKGLTGNYFGGGSTLAGHTIIFKSIKFDENLKFCEDYEYWLRLSISGINILTINTPLVTYRLHANRKTSNVFENTRWELFLRMKIFYTASISIIFNSIGILISIYGLIKFCIKFMITKLFK